MFKIAALYHFTPIDSCEDLKSKLLVCCEELEIVGGLTVATEGINGTVAGTHANIDKLISTILLDSKFEGISVKYSEAEIQPFYRIRVRISPEIITMGACMSTLSTERGVYVEPEDWNELISSPDVILIDTRNDYEIDIGTFQGALNPNTQTFRQFPEYIEKNFPSKSTKVAMYCTGGIRCEKASAFMKSKGYENIYQLHGGILKYLEVIPQDKSLWHGDCYIFDQRVSVGHGLTTGNYSLCRACRYVLSPQDLEHANFKEGIHCQYCYEKLSEDALKANAERHLQIALAEKHQRPHLGLKEAKYRKVLKTLCLLLKGHDNYRLSFGNLKWP
eukprot:gene4289-8527_t